MPSDRHLYTHVDKSILPFPVTTVCLKSYSKAYANYFIGKKY